MLSELLLFPITGPLRGVEWLAKRIRDQVDDELYSEKSLRQQLYALNERLDSGEITEEAFEEEEAMLLELLDRAEIERRDESNE